MSQADPNASTRVTLSFDRKLSDAEVEELKQKTDAVEAAKAEPTHHHDHDTKLA